MGVKVAPVPDCSFSYTVPALSYFPEQELSRHFTLRILLCHVDVDDSETPLLEINKMAVLNDFTLILAWSLQVTASCPNPMSTGAVFCPTVYERYQYGDASVEQCGMLTRLTQNS